MRRFEQKEVEYEERFIRITYGGKQKVCFLEKRIRKMVLKDNEHE